MKERFAAIFKTKTRDEWSAIFDGTDACVAPVLSMTEARDHPHNKARQTFASDWGVAQPGPAPRFSRTRPSLGRPPSAPGADTDEALTAWGFSEDELAKLRASAAIG